MCAGTLEEIVELLEVGECPRESKPALLEILKGDDPELKLRALAFTGTLRGDDVALAHAECVADTDACPEVRARAATVLGELLEKHRTSFEDSGINANALGHDCVQSILDDLESIYRAGRTPKIVRRRVLEAGSRVPRQWVRDATRAAWCGDDPEWKMSAVFAMRFLSGFEMEVEEALESDCRPLVCEAIRTAASCGQISGARDHFFDLATDESADRDCRLAAVEALRSIGSARARNVLDELRDDPDDVVAGTAAWALDEWDARNLGPAGLDKPSG